MISLMSKLHQIIIAMVVAVVVVVVVITVVIVIFIVIVIIIRSSGRYEMYVGGQHWPAMRKT